MKNIHQQLVSIIVPVYNVEKYLDECIVSILQQTYTYFELILVNDGSVDNSSEICNAYAKKDSRIQVIHKKNEGPHSAIIMGLKIAQGDFVYFIDSDDWIAPNALLNLYTAQKLGDYDLVVSSFYRVYSHEKEMKKGFSIPSGAYNADDIKTKLLPILFYNPCISGPAMNMNRCWKLFRRELLLKNLALCDTNIRLGEDWILTTPYFFSMKSMYLIENTHDYYYRFTVPSLTNIRNFYDIRINNEMIIELKKIVLAFPVNRTLYLQQLDVLASNQFITFIKEAGSFFPKIPYFKIYDKIKKSLTDYEVKSLYIPKKSPFIFLALLYLIKKKSIHILCVLSIIYAYYYRLKRCIVGVL